MALFPRQCVRATGLKHGTVTVLQGGQPYEVTTFRIEAAYSDGRHPDSVRFTKSLAADLARRDFTINAMAYSPQSGLVDLVHGRDIMALGVPQGRQVGEVLHKLLQCVLEGRLPNERQALLAYAKGLVP